MNKKILCIILAFVLITIGVYCEPLAVKASNNTSGSSVGVAYTASEIWLLLMALAGVSAEEASVSTIFDGATMDVGQLINDVMPFSRDLGLALYDVIGPGVAGAQTITMSRPMWNQWKEYWAQKAGTTIGTSSNIGSIPTNIKTWGAGSRFSYGYSVTGSGQYGGTGSFNVNVIEDDWIVFIQPIYYNGYINQYQLYYMPVTKYNSSILNSGMLTESFAGTVVPNNIPYTKSSVAYSTGYGIKYTIGGYGGQYFQSFPIPKGVFTIASTLSQSEVNTLISDKIAEYRQNGTLQQEQIVTGKTIQGVGNEAVTVAGQDVIGFGNTATQEEGEDVVIEGPLDIALPAEAQLEVLLKQLATNEITYEQFVKALQMEAVDTKTQTLAQVQAKEQAIWVDPNVGTYTVSLDDLFPFCIPFDLYDMLNCLKAEPEAPEVEISLPIGYDGNDFTWEEYTISLSAFDTVAQVGRIFWYILFCIGLMLLTRKLIEG